MSCGDCPEDGLLENIAILFTLWMIPFAGQFLWASFDNDTCNLPLKRIEYIMPGYRAGCWMFSRTQPAEKK